MNILFDTYITLLPIVATAFIGWVGCILKKRDENDKKREEAILKEKEEASIMRKANSKGIMLVLRYMLKRYHTEYVFQENITYDQAKEWRDIYDAYKALGGNSMADDWDKDVEAMTKKIELNEPAAFEYLLHKSHHLHSEK